MERREFMAASIGWSLVAGAGGARAQSGPLTKIIFPFAAGGSGDMLCRQLAQYLPPLIDRSFIVENRTGGDGLIGIRAVKGAAPDTTTVLVTTGPTMYLLPMVENQPSFDSAKDFMPVSQLTRFEFVVAVSPSIGVTDFKQLVAWIKANPSKASFGVPASGGIRIVAVSGPARSPFLPDVPSLKEEGSISSRTGGTACGCRPAVRPSSQRS